MDFCLVVGRTVGRLICRPLACLFSTFTTSNVECRCSVSNEDWFPLNEFKLIHFSARLEMVEIGLFLGKWERKITVGVNSTPATWRWKRGVSQLLWVINLMAGKDLSPGWMFEMLKFCILLHVLFAVSRGVARKRDMAGRTTGRYATDYRLGSHVRQGSHGCTFVVFGSIWRHRQLKGLVFVILIKKIVI